MEVRLTLDQEAFIQRAIESGRLQSAEDAIRQALSLWESKERRRSEILAALDESEADIQSGQYADYANETLSTLAADLKSEARAARHLDVP
jgi:putative addiction module CopG family antidote